MNPFILDLHDYDIIFQLYRETDIYEKTSSTWIYYLDDTLPG